MEAVSLSSVSEARCSELGAASFASPVANGRWLVVEYRVWPMIVLFRRFLYWAIIGAPAIMNRSTSSVDARLPDLSQEK